MKAFALAAVTVAAAGSPAFGNPVDAFGFGARAPAMGNAQTAGTRDGGANYYNPAALALFAEARLDIGYQFTSPRLEVNGLDLDVNHSRGLAVAFSAPGTVLGTRVSLGAGVFLPDEQVTRTRTLQSDQPRFVLFDNRPQRLFMGANLAIEVTDDVLIGGGIAYLSSTTGGVELGGRLGFQETDSELDLAIDVDLKTVRYPQAGILYHAAPWLDVGFAYRGGFVLDVDLAVNIEGDIGSAAAPAVEDAFFDLFSIYQDLFQPEQFALGANARLTERFTLAFDVVLHRWSRFDNPAANIDIQFDLKDFNDLVEIPEAPPLPEPNFSDILVPHVGVEWVPVHGSHAVWALRGGYIFEPSPAPDQTTETNFIDNDKHTLSLGSGLELRDVSDILVLPFDIDAYGALTLMPRRDHFKVSPVDRIGDYSSDGFIWQVGATTRWRF